MIRINPQHNNHESSTEPKAIRTNIFEYSNTIMDAIGTMKVEDISNYDNNCTHLDITRDDDGYLIKKDGISNFVCYHCKKAYIYKYDFINHKLIKHQDRKPYHCNYLGCKQLCKLKESLKMHIERIHLKKKNYVCTYNGCDNAFYRKYEYELHLKKHRAENPFKCDQCSKAFMRKCTFKIHMRVHDAEKPYQCHICYKHLKYRHSLTNHLRNIHKVSVKSKNNNNNEKSP